MVALARFFTALMGRDGGAGASFSLLSWSLLRFVWGGWIGAYTEVVSGYVLVLA